MGRDYGDIFSSSAEVYCKAIRRTQIHHLLGLILRMQVPQLSKLINYFSNNALICASVLA